MKIERYTFWQVLQKYQTVIPEIQRDYAQGRTDQRTKQLRTRFVEAIFNALQPNGSPIHLDFVYGTQTETEESFVPIDGQQRLTTLFLLHYYLADEPDAIFQKFKYSTRPTSSAFCKALGKSVLRLNSNKLENPSAFIRDAKWYKPAWNFDPSVQAMLVMLDSIHEKFSECNRQSVRELLLSQPTDKARITFDFLDMKQANLSSDLYIKMNSRGKQLTDWENFKADLQKYVDDMKWEFLYPRPTAENQLRHLGWKELMDTEWTDILWKYKDDDNFLLDEEWMRFFRAMAIIQMGSQSITDTLTKEQLDEFDQFAKQDDGFFSIDKFQKIGFLNDKENLQYVLESLELLKGDAVEHYENLLHKHLNIIVYKGALETERFFIFKRNLSKDAGLRSRLFLFAFLEGISVANNKGELEGDEGFIEWMRVWRNILQNTDFGRDNFLATCRTISLAAEKWALTGDPKEFLSLPDEQLSKIGIEQIREEREKGKLIEDHFKGAVLELLYHTENHEIFQGQIGWLLNLSKNEEGIFEINQFQKLATNASAIFTKTNLWNDQYLVHRSLLTALDYSLPKSQNRWTYGHFGEGYERSWKYWKEIFKIRSQKITKDDVKPTSLKMYLWEADLADLENYFRTRINNFLQTHYDNDYRIFLVQNPVLFGWSNLKQITWPDNFYETPGMDSELVINILSKDTHRGEHREYFTFGLEQELKSVKEVGSFTNVYHDGQYAIQGESYLVLKWKNPHGIPLEIYVEYDPKGYKSGYWFELTAKLSHLVLPELEDYFKSLPLKFNQEVEKPKSQNLSQVWYISSETHSSVIETLKSISAKIKELESVSHAQ